jgi:hypothetical protein
MKNLTKAAILKRTTLRTEKMEIPEWEGSVFIRELTGNERDEYELSIVDPETNQVNKAGMRAILVVMTLVDEEGNKLFTLDDVDQVGALSSSALSKIFNKAAKLCGITEEDIADLEKN